MAEDSLAAKKPLLRGWLHLISFEASLVLGTLTLARAHGGMRIVALAVFTASGTAMFGASALYHRGNWSSTWHQRLDHAMIFLLIAGTATPAFLIATHGVVQIAGLATVWTLTLSAGTFHMAWMNAPERLVGGTFVALGCLAIPAVWRHSGAAAGALMAVGGLLYVVQALSYHRRWLNRSPRVFGFHEVFHVHVSVAAACQYTAIVLFVASPYSWTRNGPSSTDDRRVASATGALRARSACSPTSPVLSMHHWLHPQRTRTARSAGAGSRAYHSAGPGLSSIEA